MSACSNIGILEGGVWHQLWRKGHSKVWCGSAGGAQPWLWMVPATEFYRPSAHLPWLIRRAFKEAANVTRSAVSTLLNQMFHQEVIDLIPSPEIPSAECELPWFQLGVLRALQSFQAPQSYDFGYFGGPNRGKSQQHENSSSEGASPNGHLESSHQLPMEFAVLFPRNHSLVKYARNDYARANRKGFTNLNKKNCLRIFVCGIHLSEIVTSIEKFRLPVSVSASRVLIAAPSVDEEKEAQ